MKLTFTALLLLCLTFAQAQKIMVDPTFTRPASAPESELFTIEGYGAGRDAWPFQYISYDTELPSLISFVRKEGKYKENVTVVVHKNHKKFSIQYILYNAANPKGVWFAIQKAQLTLNKPFTNNAGVMGKLSFSFSGTILNSAGQPEKVSGTVEGTFAGTIGKKYSY